jgi:DUF4097 and DUF4098 domain-containing protein YvlB
MSARYELPPGHCLRVTSSSGDITVIAEERDDVEAPQDARVEARSGEEQRDERPKKRHHRRKGTLRFLRRLVKHAVRGEFLYGGRSPGPTLEIRSPNAGSRDLEVRCPAGAPISVGTISGDVRISGDLEVDCCSGLCRLITKSGHIEASDTGPAEADTVSGYVRLGRTAGGVTVRTVSGSVELGTDGTEPVKVRTISGGITIKVPKERLPAAKLRSLSGKINCDCLQGSDFPLEVTSVSGKIEVEPA